MNSNCGKYKDIFSQVLLIILSTFLAVIGYPLGTLVFVPLVIYRHVAERLAQRIDPKFGEILKGFDAYFAAHTPYSNPIAVLLPVYYLDKPVDKTDLIKVFDEKLFQLRDQNGNLMYQRFRQKIVSKFGYNFWYNFDSFDLHHHIKFLNEYCPEEVVKEKDIMQLTCQLSKRPFDEHRSPWEILLIPKFEHAKDATIKSMLIMRFHHCLCDGFSILKLLERIGIKPWKHSNLGVASTNNGANKKNPLYVFLNSLYLLIEAPYQVVKTVLFSYDDNLWLTRTIQNSNFGSLRTQLIDQISLAQLKGFKLEGDTEKINVSSIMIALIVQATAIVMKRENVSGNLSKLHVALPLPLPNHPGNGLCNHWTSVKIPINVDVEDVRNTVRNASREYEGVRRSIIPRVSLGIVTLVGYLPIPFIPKSEGLLRSTCFLSNFPGPAHPVDICGSEVKVLFTTANATGGAIGAISFSYNGTINFVIGGHQFNLNQEGAEILAESCRNIVKQLLSRE